MSATATTVEFDADSSRVRLDTNLEAEIAGYFSARCGGIDAGESDIHEGLRFLAERGLVGATELPTQAAAVRSVAASCMSSAFALWAQVMVITYLDRAESAELRTLASLLRDGTLAGSTAMAGAFQDADGFRPLDITYRRDGDDLIIDGVIRWASNLRPDGFIMVLGARDADGNRVIVAVPSDADGLAVRPFLDLLALGGTASSSLELSGVRVPSSWIVTESFDTFVDSVRPTFLLLQSAFCLGLVDAALASVATNIDRAYDGFRDEYVALSSELDELSRRHSHLLESTPAKRDLIEIRLGGAALAQAAVALESRVVGGAGYLANSPTARRLREAAFLPIQSPTEGHLRWQLAALAS